MHASDLPSTREQLLDRTIQQNRQIVQLIGALGDLVDAVERGGDLGAALDRARLALGRAT